MSYELSALQRTEFEAEVHQEFRGVVKEFLDLARIRRVEGAGEVQFPVFGYSKMKPHVPGQLIEPASGKRAPVKFSLTPYALGDYTDVFMQASVNFDEKQEFIKTLVDAFKNNSVQRILDALAASTTSNTVANTISGAADNLTVDAVIKAGEILDDLGVPNDGNRIFMASSSGVHSLAKDPRVTSMDFAAQAMLKTGKLDGFYGFKMRMIPKMLEGGLPKTGNDRTCFAYHQWAMGYGANVTEKIDVQYYNNRGAHFVSGLQSNGAKEIDPIGIVKVATVE